MSWTSLVVERRCDCFVHAWLRVLDWLLSRSRPLPSFVHAFVLFHFVLFHFVSSFLFASPFLRSHFPLRLLLAPFTVAANPYSVHSVASRFLSFPSLFPSRFLRFSAPAFPSLYFSLRSRVPLPRRCFHLRPFRYPFACLVLVSFRLPFLRFSVSRLPRLVSFPLSYRPCSSPEVCRCIVSRGVARSSLKAHRA